MQYLEPTRNIDEKNLYNNLSRLWHGLRTQRDPTAKN